MIGRQEQARSARPRQACKVRWPPRCVLPICRRGPPLARTLRTSHLLTLQPQKQLPVTSSFQRRSIGCVSLVMKREGKKKKETKRFSPSAVVTTLCRAGKNTISTKRRTTSEVDRRRLLSLAAFTRRQAGKYVHRVNHQTPTQSE